MSHLTKAVSKMKDLTKIKEALTALNISFEYEPNSKKLAKSNYSSREDVKVDLLLTQFKGSKGVPSIGFVKEGETFTLIGDSWTVKDVNPSRTPKFSVLEAHTGNFNMNQFGQQVTRFYNLFMVKESIEHKGLTLEEDTVKEFKDGKDTKLKFTFASFINGDEIKLDCVSDSNGGLTYEVKGVKGSGCKDITDFLDSQLTVLSTVETEEMNMELDVEQSHSEWH